MLFGSIVVVTYQNFNLGSVLYKRLFSQWHVYSVYLFIWCFTLPFKCSRTRRNYSMLKHAYQYWQNWRVAGYCKRGITCLFAQHVSKYCHAVLTVLCINCVVSPEVSLLPQLTGHQRHHVRRQTVHHRNTANVELMTMINDRIFDPFPFLNSCPAFKWWWCLCVSKINRKSWLVGTKDVISEYFVGLWCVALVHEGGSGVSPFAW